MPHIFFLDGSRLHSDSDIMLSETEFQNLAKLARLDPSDKSLAALRNDFNKILDFVNTISQAKASVNEDYHPANLTMNHTRPDQAEQPLSLKTMSEMAPKWEAGHFVVPGVLTEEH